nr:MAG TPA: MlrC C-terminus [Caudoviricetes sp.]
MVQVHPPDFFYFFGVTLWKKIIVVLANGTHWKRAYAVMVTVNIGQILDA